MRPLVLLDVDGVINDLRRGVDRPWSTNFYTALGYTISVPEYMPDLLADVHAIADIVWCTTWESKANQYISPLVGLPTDLQFTPLTWTAHSVTDAKSPGAERASSLHRIAEVPVVWVEDFDFAPDIARLTPLSTVPEFVLTPARGADLIDILKS